MKPPVLIALIVILLSLLAMAYDLYSSPQTVPARPETAQPEPQNQTPEHENAAPVPAFTFTDLNGKTHNIRDYNGSIVLVNFWATYCPPCVNELPAMFELVKTMEGKVKLIALSSDENEADVRKFFAKMKSKGKPDPFANPHVTIALDADSKITAGLFMTERFPETVIIAPSGTMTRKIVGEIDWSGEEIRSYLEDLSK